MHSIPASSPLRMLDPKDIKCVAVDSSQLPTLYSSVDCLLFPSIYEGFGYPVVEALACGTPVVCSNLASLPEVGGDLAMYYASDDYKGMATAVRQLIRGEVDMDLCREGPKWVDKFRANRVAKQFYEHYQQL